MKEAVKAFMKGQRQWIQHQIAKQNQKTEVQQQQMMDQFLTQLLIQEEKIRSSNGSGFEMGARANLNFNPRVEFPYLKVQTPKD